MSVADGRRGRSKAPPPEAGQAKPALPAPDAPPYRLFWPLGIVAIVLGLTAFVLWVTRGGVILFDMIIAFCF